MENCKVFCEFIASNQSNTSSSKSLSSQSSSVGGGVETRSVCSRPFCTVSSCSSASWMAVVRIRLIWRTFCRLKVRTVLQISRKKRANSSSWLLLVSCSSSSYPPPLFNACGVGVLASSCTACRRGLLLWMPWLL